MTFTRSRTPAAVSVPLAAGLDALLLVVFAAIGRGSHSESLSAAGIAGTAWPFLVGAALGWAGSYVRFGRAPTDVAGGVLVWVGAIAGGMVLRAVTGQGVAISFIAVASIVTALVLLGWRAIARLLARGRGRTPSTGSGPRTASPHR